MPTDQMYELAFRFMDLKLWDKVFDDEAFAVLLPDGETGYCSVMGRMGDHFGLGLYVGEEGYRSYRMLLDADKDDLDEFRMRELMTSQSCLHCSFEERALLLDEEAAEVRRYTKAHGRKIRGKNGWPQFEKYRPGRIPWPMDPEEDGPKICEALSAAIALDGMLRTKSKEELGLQTLYEEAREIPLLVREDGGWTVRSAELPSSEAVYPEPLFTNEVMALRLKRKKKKGVWECGTVRLTEPVEDEERPDGVPFYPLLLVYIEPGTDLLEPIMGDGEDPAEMLNEFAERLMKKDSLPRTVFCADDRCYALLKDICLKSGIGIERTDEMTELYNAMEYLLDHLDDDDDYEPDEEDVDEMFETLMGMSDSELRQMPKELADMMFSLALEGELPEELGSRIRKLFRKKK